MNMGEKWEDTLQHTYHFIWKKTFFNNNHTPIFS